MSSGTSSSDGQVQPKKSSASQSKYLWSEELNTFLVSLDSYTPTIPDAAVKYYCNKVGMNVIDNRVTRVIAMAADKYLADLVHDSSQYAALRNSASKSSKKREAAEAVEDNHILEPEDLERALSNQRVRVKLPRRANVAKPGENQTE